MRLVQGCLQQFLGDFLLKLLAVEMLGVPGVSDKGMLIEKQLLQDEKVPTAMRDLQVADQVSIRR